MRCFGFFAGPHGAAGPQSWRLEGARAFLDGELTGLSLDSEGRLRLGVAPRPLFDPEAPNAWSVARDAAGWNLSAEYDFAGGATPPRAVQLR